LPGIGPVAAASNMPFNDNSHYYEAIRFPDSGQKIMARCSWNAVTPDFFAAMGIPILQGVTFPAAGADGNLVVVNSTFVQRYLGGRQPVGTTFLLGPKNIPCRIAGVVAGTKTITIGEEQQAQLYEPLDKKDDKLRVEFVMRSSIRHGLQLEAVRRELHGLEPMAGAEVETMYSSLGFAFLPTGSAHSCSVPSVFWAGCLRPSGCTG
jgi:hypothetical protein